MFSNCLYLPLVCVAGLTASTFFHLHTKQTSFAQSSPTNSQNFNPEKLSEAIYQSKQFLTTECLIQGIPGCTLSVMKNHKLIWSFAYGYIDIEHRIPTTTRSLFRIASISKTFTSAGIALLIQQKKLHLNDKIQKYMPDYPLLPIIQSTDAKIDDHKEELHSILVHQLLNHTSGIRDYKNNEFAQTQAYATSTAAIAIFKNDPLLFKPGTKFSYSTYNYTVVSAIIEQIAQTNFLYFMNDEIFYVLRMYDTVHETNANIICHRSKQYQRIIGVDDRFRNDTHFHINGDVKGREVCAYPKNRYPRLYHAPYVNNSNKYGGGGYLSTADDIVLFADAIVLSDVLLNEETKRLLFDVKENSEKYGCGWVVNEKEGEGEMKNVEISHSGGAIGGCSHVLVIPDDHLVVCILINLEEANPYITRQVAKYFKDI